MQAPRSVQAEVDGIGGKQTRVGCIVPLVDFDLEDDGDRPTEFRHASWARILRSLFLGVTEWYTKPAPRGAMPLGNPDTLDFGMTTMTIQVRGRGTLTLPASLREKYRLGEGDPLTVVDLDGAVLLSPRLLVVPRLAAEMERLRRARKLSLKDLGGPARED